MVCFECLRIVVLAAISRPNSTVPVLYEVRHKK